MILLARHGAHDEVGHVLSGRSAIALNAAGQRQAAALAEALRDMGLRAIQSSPRRRCVDTAAAVAAATGLAVAAVPALDEIDFGRFAGQSFDALEDDADWHAWNAARASARCPGGETMEEAVGRALGHLRNLHPADGAVLCVTHCDIIRGVAARLLGLGLDLQHLLALPCDPGSLTLLEGSGDALRVVTLNQRPAHDAAADQ